MLFPSPPFSPCHFLEFPKCTTPLENPKRVDDQACHESTLLAPHVNIHAHRESRWLTESEFLNSSNDSQGFRVIHTNPQACQRSECTHRTILIVTATHRLSHSALSLTSRNPTSLRAAAVSPASWKWRADDTHLVGDTPPRATTSGRLRVLCAQVADRSTPSPARRGDLPAPAHTNARAVPRQEPRPGRGRHPRARDPSQPARLRSCPLRSLRAQRLPAAGHERALRPAGRRCAACPPRCPQGALGQAAPRQLWRDKRAKTTGQPKMTAWS